MAKQWEEFEKLVAHLHAAVLPHADVKHNVKIRGRSGRLRQVDVAITTQAAGYPVLIALECKRHSRPVGIREVEAFASKLRDVRASQGVLIAAGFDEGARAVASEHLVTLLTYEEISGIDWKVVFGESSQMCFHRSRTKITHIDAQLLSSRPNPALHLDMKIVDAEEKPVGTLQSIMEWGRSIVNNSARVGAVGLKLTPEEPWYVIQSESREQIVQLTFEGVRSVREYVVYPLLAWGHVLRNAETNSLQYSELWTQELQVMEWFPPDAGHELTQEEFEQRRTRMPGITLRPEDTFKMRVSIGPGRDD